MLFGITVNATMMVIGGTALFSLIIFQMLEGKRKIRFKGPLHMKIHRAVAWLILLFAVLHGLAALAFLGFISF
jgi:cytochrome b561